MPVTNQVLYPGSTYDLSFGGAGFSWAIAPTPAGLSDAIDSQAETTYGLFNPSTVDPRTVYAEFGLADIPIGIVSIASLRIIAWAMATGLGGTYDTDVSGMVRPAGTGFGGGGDYYSTPIVLTSNNAAVEIYSALEFGAWTTNPATAAPWTKSDLAALKFGVRFEAPATGIATASEKLGRLRVLIEATSIAANTEAVRTLLSMPLRLFSRGLESGQIVAPALAADVGLAETFTLEHTQGRRPGRIGWTRELWGRGFLFCESKSVDFLTGQTTLKWRIPRRTRMWIPGLTTLGHSLEALGLPLLHSGGGGPSCARAQVKYINRPGNPPDNVMQGTTEDLLAHDYRGMAIEAGGDTNLILNSTFSQNTFDNWTTTTSGTGLVFAEPGRVGVDETGLRRGAGAGVGATPGSLAYLTQTVTVATDFRMQIRTFNSSGTGKLSVVIQRASDSKYWNDSGNTWGVGITYNRIGEDGGGYKEWVSKKISAGADNITVSIGYFGEGSDGDFGAYLWSVDLVEGTDHTGTPLVTTTTTVTRIADVVTIPNGDVGRWFDFVRGFSFTVGAIPLWDYSALGSGEIRIILHVDLGSGNYAQVLYQRGVEAIDDRFVFSVFFSAVAYTAEYVVEGHADLEPMRGRLVKISCRYVGDEGELDLPVGQIAIAVYDDWDGGTPATLPSAPTVDPTSVGYLGSTGSEGWWNGFIRQLDVSPTLQTEEEMERQPS